MGYGKSLRSLRGRLYTCFVKCNFADIDLLLIGGRSRRNFPTECIVRVCVCLCDYGRCLELEGLNPCACIGDTSMRVRYGAFDVRPNCFDTNDLDNKNPF